MRGLCRVLCLTVLLCAPRIAHGASSTCNDVFFCFGGTPCSEADFLLGVMQGAVDSIGELLCFVGDSQCTCFQDITGDAAGARFDQWMDRIDAIIDQCGNSSSGGRSVSGIAFEAATQVCAP